MKIKIRKVLLYQLADVAAIQQLSSKNQKKKILPKKFWDAKIALKVNLIKSVFFLQYFYKYS